jgi:hypothetical protein
MCHLSMKIILCLKIHITTIIVVFKDQKTIYITDHDVTNDENNFYA